VAEGARSASGSIESDAEIDVVLEILEDCTRVPEWAPPFADLVTQDGPSCIGWKDGREFVFRVAAVRHAGTVDYLRELAPGVEGGGYLRVVPRPGGGSVITMVLPIAPDADPATVQTNVADELAALAALADAA
jgi:hypothetical protein